MKVVILAGGFGTRLSEETAIKPKPMAEIGGKPILWHIMKIYATQGYTDFVILCGYKSYVIKQYFLDYGLNRADITIDLANHTTEVHQNGAEPWKITLIETGKDTNTGGRLLKAKPYLDNERFFFTYGDNVADIDLKKLLELHTQHNVLATVTAVQPAGRFGAFAMGANEVLVEHFREKSQEDSAWINGGFFVIEPQALDYISGEDIDWSKEPMSTLAHDGKLAAYKHSGYWQNMDSLRDKMVLEEHWDSGHAPWKTWD